MSERTLKFKIRKGDLEIELEGEQSYVKEKFEKLWEKIASPILDSSEEASIYPSLKGILETTPHGRPYLTVPVDTLGSKEAVAFFIYTCYPKGMSDKQLSELLTSSWKVTRPEAVRARASELRREGKLISEKGVYTLSGAGVQWVETSIITKIKAAKQNNRER